MGYQYVIKQIELKIILFRADVGQLGVLFEGDSQLDARKVTYMSLLQIFANPNKILD